MTLAQAEQQIAKLMPKGASFTITRTTFRYRPPRGRAWNHVLYKIDAKFPGSKRNNVRAGHFTLPRALEDFQYRLNLYTRRLARQQQQAVRVAGSMGLRIAA